MGRGWRQADSLRLAGEGAALSRLIQNQTDEKQIEIIHKGPLGALCQAGMASMRGEGGTPMLPVGAGRGADPTLRNKCGELQAAGGRLKPEKAPAKIQIHDSFFFIHAFGKRCRIAPWISKRSRARLSAFPTVPTKMYGAINSFR